MLRPPRSAWDDDLRADLRHDFGGLGRRQRRLPADRDQQHVDRAELAELLVGEEVAQVAEMADVDAVDLEGEDHVLAAGRARPRRRGRSGCR